MKLQPSTAMADGEKFSLCGNEAYVDQHCILRWCGDDKPVALISIWDDRWERVRPEPKPCCRCGLVHRPPWTCPPKPVEPEVEEWEVVSPLPTYLCGHKVRMRRVKP